MARTAAIGDLEHSAPAKPGTPLAARARAVAVPLLSLLALFGLWQIAAWSADRPQLMPGPLLVLDRLVEETLQGDLLYHLGVTLARVAAAFVVAMAIGTVLGLLMGRIALADQFGHPWLVFFLNIPALVTIVLAYIWIGLVEAAVVTAVALNKIPNVVVMVREGARALDPDLQEMARIFRIGRFRTLRHVVLPQLYPYLTAAARSGLA
ncbi:MAG: ABC transporter permease subunit, partial [Geminicoccaceae bacterium]|nr:ABC transporter permease subunit [Geminicoccaceae bacterium]